MHILYLEAFSVGRSRWPFGLRRRTATAQLLGLRVRSLLRSRILVSWVRCVGSGLCDDLVTCSEELYRVCVCVWCVVCVCVWCVCGVCMCGVCGVCVCVCVCRLITQLIFFE